MPDAPVVEVQLEPLDMAAIMKPKFPDHWHMCRDTDTDWCCANVLFLRRVPMFLSYNLTPRKFLSYQARLTNLSTDKFQHIMFRCGGRLEATEIKVQLNSWINSFSPRDRPNEKDVLQYDRIMAISDESIVEFTYGPFSLACENPPWKAVLEDLENKTFVNIIGKTVPEKRGFCIPDVDAIMRDKSHGKTRGAVEAELARRKKQLKAGIEVEHQRAQTNYIEAARRPDEDMALADIKRSFKAWLTASTSQGGSCS